MTRIGLARPGGRSSARQTGIQKRRMNRPIGVAGPVRARSNCLVLILGLLPPARTAPQILRCGYKA
jgi:hypothetical protein